MVAVTSAFASGIAVGLPSGRDVVDLYTFRSAAGW
jgi:hypothetical protein